MKLLIQKVTEAKVYINNKKYSEIKNGYCIFLGINKNDTQKNIDFLVDKILKLKILESDNSHFSSTVIDNKNEILVVSQFTLYGSFKKGNKPSFSEAMDPNNAKLIYDIFIQELKNKYSKVKTGKFGANMQIELINNGPVTFILEN